MIMLKTLFFFVFTTCSFISYTQDKYAQSIDVNRLKTHLSILASDSLEGRNTGEKGQKLAADYLHATLTSMGLKPNVQSFELYKKNKSGKVKLLNQELQYPQDLGFNGYYNPLLIQAKIRVYKDMRKVEWTKLDSSSIIGLHIASYKEFDVKSIPENKAKIILLFCKNYHSNYFTDYNTHGLAYPGAKNGTLYIYVDAKKIKSFSKKSKKELSIELDLNANPEKVVTENVMTLIEGNDPKLKNEILVISAHYDHIGIEDGVVFNGADDNGSGSSALLELARVFLQAKKEKLGNKRSILFIWFTGEEHGLFGSEYYSDHPYLPLKQTVTNLNIDMIGRADSLSEKEKYKVFVIGSDRLSMDLHNANATAATQYTTLNLDYTYNDPNDKLKLYYRSDHFNFAKNGIPSIFYFGGFHPDYHQSTDDIEKIDFAKIREISILVYHTAQQICNAEKRPQLKP